MQVQCSTGWRRFKGTEDQREKAPSFLNFMLAVIDSFTKRQEKKEKNRNKLFQYKKQPVNFKAISIRTNTRLNCFY